MELLLLVLFFVLVLFIDNRYTKWVIKDLGVQESDITWRLNVVIFMAAVGTPTAVVGLLVWILKFLMWILGVPA